MKGAYVLLLNLPKNERIEIGKLGSIEFKKGNYAYIGSAMNRLEKRIERHMSKDKKIHWHIDYFIKKAKIKEVLMFPSKIKEECIIAKKFERVYLSIPKFGCSDCKCDSHLFYLFPTPSF